jgi:galactokinase
MSRPHRPPDAVAGAPARVNLIGEHTDYCQGFVLPLPLQLGTHVALWRRADGLVHARTALGAGEEEEYRLGAEQPGRGWLDYLQGVTAALRRLGSALEGVDVEVSSDIPAGAGLASSAALTVGFLRALRVAFRLPLNNVSLAHLACAAETDFVGAPVGLMDPLTASLGSPGRALFIDLRSLAVEETPLPTGLEVGVLDSGVAHHNAGGTYAERRREAETAARGLGVAALRDVGMSELARVARLPPPLNRRARHVVTENARVLAFLGALRAGALDRLGPLLAASHASLRDDYEVSHPDVDALVALAQADAEVLGARMTGGGCGGAVLFLTPTGRAAETGCRLAAAYRGQTGRAGALLVPAASCPA